MSSSVPAKASEYTLWLANFNTVASANAQALGLSSQEIASLINSAIGVNSTIAGAVTAQSNAKAAIKTKQQTLRGSEKMLRGFAKRIQANSNVSDALRRQLGLPVRQPASHTAPVVPAALTVSGQSDGTNVLAWNTMGNKPNTTYLVEYQTAANGAWTLLDSTMRAKYAATGFVPGQRTSYRVRARRNDQSSAYSNEAVIYGNL